MPVFEIQLTENHVFGAEVEAATATEAIVAARAMWNERRRRGIPDVVGALEVHCVRKTLIMPTAEETRRIKPPRKRRPSEETTRVIVSPERHIITKPNLWTTEFLPGSASVRSA